MLELNRQRSLEYEESMIGKNLEILLEEEMELRGEAYYLGRQPGICEGSCGENRKSEGQ